MKFANILVILLVKLMQLTSAKPQYANYPGYPVQSVTYNPLSPTFSDLNVIAANPAYGSANNQIRIWPYVIGNTGYNYNQYARPTLQTTNTYNPNLVYDPNTGAYGTNTNQNYNPNLLSSWYGYSG